MQILNKISIIAATAALAAALVGPVAAFAAGPDPVNLLSAGNFVILSKTGITNTGSHTSAIVGNIGASPITAAAMDNVFCSEMTGTIFGVDAAYTGSGSQTCFSGNPPLANKTLVDNAVLDMATAYTDAAGRTNPTATELGAGNIGGLTIAPGLYKWSTDVTIPTDVTLAGSANDVWIFQISGNLNIASAGSVASGIKVILAGGAKASNIFWQVGGETGATLGTYSTFNGVISSAKQIILQTGAVLNGRALAQTQVTLDANSVSAPISSVIGATPATPATPAIPAEPTITPAVPAVPATPATPSTGNSSSTTARDALIAQITAQINTIRGQINAQMVANPNASFNRNLTVGASGADVKGLQIWLNTHGYAVATSGPGSLGNETMTFGGLTRLALSKLQAVAGISPTAGYFGAKTRAYLSAH